MLGGSVTSRCQVRVRAHPNPNPGPSPNPNPNPNDFTLPDGCAIVTDVNEVLDDEAVELVVEVMGGTDLAKTVVTSALRSGKHVVTANKALIAAHLPELNALVASVNAGRADKVRFGYEAA